MLSEILGLVSDLPEEEQFTTLAKALLFVSETQLLGAWSDGDFEQVQARTVKKFENMARFVGTEPDIELMKLRVEWARAIEEGNAEEVDRLNQELIRRMERLDS